MSNNESFDFTKTCRLCSNQSKFNQLLSIFDISAFDLQYSIIISECTGVMVASPKSVSNGRVERGKLQLSENDKLPKGICLDCLKCLIQFYQFRKLVVNSERRLTNYLNNCPNKDLKTTTTIYIKEENVSNEEEPTCSRAMTSALGEMGDIEDDFEMEDKIEIVENEVLTIRGKNEDLEDNLEETDDPLTHFQPLEIPNFEYDESLVCKQCGKLLGNIASLRRHKKVHTGEKPHICNQCGRPFSELSNLRKHERLHRGEKPYSCNICGKSFSLYQHLEKHGVVHTGARPYSCDHCGKTFTQRATLRIHIRLHTGEKPYVCDYCGRAFIEISNLKSHKRRHTGERPYVCKTCGSAFSHSCNLRKHEKTHKGIN